MLSIFQNIRYLNPPYTNQTWAFIGLNIFLFIAIFITVYFVRKFFSDKEHLMELLNNTYEQLRLDEDILDHAIRNNQSGVEGEVEKKPLLDRINDYLIYSGLQLKFPFLNIKTFLFLFGLSSFLVFAGVDIFTGNLLYGIAGAIIFVFVIYLILFSLRIMNYNNTEKDITLFMNMVNNFSASSDDIISILERASGYLNNPIKAAIQAACGSAKSDGNITLSLKDLQNKVEHPLFKRLVSNLELSSRHACDYRDIIEDSRERIESALANASRRKAIYSSCRVNIFMLLGLGAFLMWESMGFVDNGMSFWELMNQNIFGKIILGFVLISYGVSIYYAIFKLRDHS